MLPYQKFFNWFIISLLYTALWTGCYYSNDNVLLYFSNNFFVLND